MERAGSANAPVAVAHPQAPAADVAAPPRAAPALAQDAARPGVPAALPLRAPLGPSGARVPLVAPVHRAARAPAGPVAPAVVGEAVVALRPVAAPGTRGFRGVVDGP